MTIEQRQVAAEAWADAYYDWQAAEEQANRYDAIRVQAYNRLDSYRADFVKACGISALSPARVFLLPDTNSTRRELVRISYSNKFTDNVLVELLKTEPNE